MGGGLTGHVSNAYSWVLCCVAKQGHNPGHRAGSVSRELCVRFGLSHAISTHNFTVTPNKVRSRACCLLCHHVPRLPRSTPLPATL